MWLHLWIHCQLNAVTLLRNENQVLSLCFSLPALLTSMMWSMSSVKLSLETLTTLSSPSVWPRSATTHSAVTPALPSSDSASSACRVRRSSPLRATRTSTDRGFTSRDISFATARPKPLEAPVMMHSARPRSLLLVDDMVQGCGGRSNTYTNQREVILSADSLRWQQQQLFFCSFSSEPLVDLSPSPGYLTIHTH